MGFVREVLMLYDGVDEIKSGRLFNHYLSILISILLRLVARLIFCMFQFQWEKLVCCIEVLLGFEVRINL